MADNAPHIVTWDEDEDLFTVYKWEEGAAEFMLRAQSVSILSPKFVVQGQFPVEWEPYVKGKVLAVNYPTAGNYSELAITARKENQVPVGYANRHWYNEYTGTWVYEASSCWAYAGIFWANGVG